MEILKMYGFLNDKNKVVNNHFVVNGTNNKVGLFVIFKSYDTNMCIYLLDYSKMIVNTTKYSNTTSKYRNMFIDSINHKKLVEFDEAEFNNYYNNWIK